MRLDSASDVFRAVSGFSLNKEGKFSFWQERAVNGLASMPARLVHFRDKGARIAHRTKLLQAPELLGCLGA